MTLRQWLLCPASATPRQGRWALLACGAAWALFCLALDATGHEPTRAPLPRWYRVQAVLLLPLMHLWGWVLAAIAGRLARRDLRGPLGVALGLPLLLGFVVPDVLVFALGGFDALWPAMLGYGSAAVVWSVGASVAATRARLGGGVGRALRVVLPAWLAAAALGSMVLR